MVIANINIQITTFLCQNKFSAFINGITNDIDLISKVSLSNSHYFLLLVVMISWSVHTPSRMIIDPWIYNIWLLINSSKIISMKHFGKRKINMKNDALDICINKKKTWKSTTQRSRLMYLLLKIINNKMRGLSWFMRIVPRSQILDDNDRKQ